MNVLLSVYAKCIDGQEARDLCRIDEVLAASLDKRTENGAAPLWRRTPDGGMEFYYPPNTVVQRITREELEAGGER